MHPTSIVAQQDKLARPYDLARDRDGNIVVSDSGTLRVVLSNNANSQVFADAVRFSPAE